MKKILTYILIIPFFLMSCGKINETETAKNPIITEKQTSAVSNNSPKTEDWGKISQELDILSKQSPFKELYESKKWKLLNIPKGSSWEFTTDTGSPISISYEWTSGENAVLKINNITTIDTSKCLKWENKAWNFSEDDPIFVKADCKKQYHGFRFNNTEVEHDFKNSIDEILVSKTESKIAIYWGKLVIDFEKGDYTTQENTSDFKRDDFILLTRVY